MNLMRFMQSCLAQSKLLFLENFQQRAVQCGRLFCLWGEFMAEAKKTKREQFENAVYELGLKLIEDYRMGNCRDSQKTLDSIIELFKFSQVEAKRNGI